MSTEQAFTEDGLRTLLHELLEGWDADRGAKSGFESTAHAARVGTIYALAAHAHRLGRAVERLLDGGFRVEAMPSIRAAFETAITAAWIEQVPDALPAYLNRNRAQQQALRDTAVRAGWSATRDARPIPADASEDFLVSRTSKEGARNTEAMCRDLTADSQAYAVYRALSWYTHPTALVTDLYLILADDAAVPTLRTSSKYEPNFMMPWIHIMCSSLVWAGRALNLIDSKRANNGDRKRLRDAAKQLKISEMLLATPEAIFRGEKAERTRIRRDTTNSC